MIEIDRAKRRSVLTLCLKVLYINHRHTKVMWYSRTTGLGEIYIKSLINKDTNQISKGLSYSSRQSIYIIYIYLK